MRLPHPAILMLGGIVIAAVLTWVLPAGEFDRREDPSTGRQLAVGGTYHAVPRAPVGPLAVAVAVPRGFVEAAEVVAAVLFVGAAWIVVDRLGTLAAVVTALVSVFRSRRRLAIPCISLFFAAMGALENMQEEIIPLVPVLLALGAGLGIDAVTVVAMSAGAAIVGSAFGPANPFQAGIALKLAQLSPGDGMTMRVVMFIVGVSAWTLATMRYASRHQVTATIDPRAASSSLGLRHTLVLCCVLLPMAAYVYGAVRLDWGFNYLSGLFFAGAVAAGLVGGFTAGETMATYLDGMAALVSPAVLIGFARSISVVLTDGHVVDTILNALAAPLASLSPVVSAFSMVPFHGLVHIAVPSVSGQAVLTMPLMVPLADVLGLSRQVSVLAYQTGAGLMELLTPTNGALMAVLLAAGVPFDKWVRFTLVAVLGPLLVGLAGIAAAVWMAA